ncbi:hypothetical protein BDW66DRAFT_156283 [Aspergillus desertorum]
MDPFIRLPWFALKSVLSALPDLFSLHSLCSASPSVAAFLRENNDLLAQIIDTIMAKPSRDRVILLRSRQSIGTCAVYSYAEIVESCSALNDTISCAFNLLDLVTQLRCVAHKCFHSMIDRCLKLPIEHLSQRDFTAQGMGMRVGKYRNVGPPTDPSQRPQGIPYVPVNIGPMTRLEEQRLIGSLLHIVVFYELRAVYTESPTIPEISQHADVLLVGIVSGLPELLKTVLLSLDEQAGGRENVLSWLRSFACCKESQQQYTLVAGDQEQWDETKRSIMYGKSRGYDCLWRSKMSVHSPIRLEALGYPTEGNPMPLALPCLLSFQNKTGKES